MPRILAFGVAFASVLTIATLARPAAQRIVDVAPPEAVVRTWSCLTRSIAEQSVFRPPASVACTAEAPRPPVRLAPRGMRRLALPLVAPAAPTSLGATISVRTVVLTWTAPAGGDPPSSYVLEAGSASGLSDITNVDTGSASTTLTATDVAPGSYFVRVRARNASGTSAASNEITVIVGGGCSTPPGAPTELAALVNGSSVTLSWQRPDTTCGPTLYVIEAGSAPGLTNLAIVPTGNDSTTYTAADVGTGTYYVRVRATNAAGSGAASNEIQLTIATCLGAPTAPTGFAAQVSGTTVVLTWNASSGSPASYQLEAGSFPGATDILVSDTGTTATTLTATASPATYYVRLRGRNTCGVSAPSADIAVVVSVVGSPCTYSLSPVAVLAGEPGGVFTTSLATAPGCAWTAASNTGFLTVSSAASGTGSATITFTAQSNAGIGRGGTLTIGGRTVTVTQAGAQGFANCVSEIIHCHGLNCDTQTFGGSGGTSEVIVGAASDCAWVASATAPWVTVYSTRPEQQPYGVGPGHFGFAVEANPTASSRSATIVAGGATFSITQQGR